MKRIIGMGLFALGLLGCEERELKLCDITTSSCQQSIYYADLRVRGDGYDPFGGIPPIRTISEDQYRSELQAESKQSSQTDSSQPWWDNALALLHLMPAAAESTETSIENQVSNVAAYYDPTSRKVTVIDHPLRADADPDVVKTENMITLAHELVHALQDREMVLKIEPESTDELFAMKAQIEGDSTLYEYLFWVELDPSVKDRLPDALSYTTRLRTLYTDNFEKLGPPLLAALYLVYPFGGMWMSEHYKEGGNSAVRHAYAKAPKRSLEYLLPFGSTAPVSQSDCQPIVPQTQGFVTRGMDTFGAAQFFGYLMGWGTSGDDALAAARLWRGDAVFVAYNATTKKTAVSWRIELSAPISDKVLTQITTTNGPRILQEGSTLLITASDDGTVTESWKPSSACN
jgi:hypothetical protein